MDTTREVLTCGWTDVRLIGIGQMRSRRGPCQKSLVLGVTVTDIAARTNTGNECQIGCIDVREMNRAKSASLDCDS